MRPYEFHPAAEFELQDAFGYYAGIDSELGQRFVIEIQRLLDDISRDAERYRLYRAPARRALSFKFPYAIIFRIADERVFILAVAHYSRRLGHWRKRLKG